MQTPFVRTDYDQTLQITEFEATISTATTAHVSTVSLGVSEPVERISRENCFDDSAG
jgi:hypothetical protein